MSDSRERFEAWTQESPYQLQTYINGALKGEYRDLEIQFAWKAWQAAEQETARRCAQVAGPEDSYQDEHFKAKADSVARIRKEFPEAWK